MTKTAHTCTVVVSADGTRCGKPAVYTFTASTGETFAECAEHYAGPVGAVTTGHKVGDRVEVHRYGKTYTATVVKVGARGAVYAEFVYGNGARRTVRV